MGTWAANGHVARFYCNGGLAHTPEGCVSGVRGGLGAGRHARMRPGQPLAQFLGGLVRRRSIKRHQRCRDSRHSDEVCPPVEGVGRDDLDVVRPTTDGFEEAMNSRVHCYGPTRVVCWERRGLSRLGHTRDKRSAVRRSRPQPPYAPYPQQTLVKTLFLPRHFHRLCTVHPQVFHSLDASAPPPYA